MQRVRLRIEGRVQGVGFRPTVYRLARRFPLTGFVKNTGFGVLIEAQGEQNALNQFIACLQSEKPRQAVIESLQSEEINPLAENDFSITESVRSGDLCAGMPPDMAICALCRQELFDPGDRRRQYPFINCTDCGPRFSIIRALPYDRKRTTMASFQMCPACQEEFTDPLNRRFEAQPNACPVCGPRVELLDADFNAMAGDPIAGAIELLKAGKILAVKGIGGYHLCCDALNADAVRLLRERKKRPDKPLAVMFKSLPQIREYCRLTDEEAAELKSVAAPVVILQRKGKKSLADTERRLGQALAVNISPDTNDVGAFLPYAPLHCLILEEIAPLVMTSGNKRDEPIAINEDDLKNILGDIADAALTHNRPIVRRCDDSVLRIVRAGKIMLRRSRGFVPAAIRLPVSGPPVLACGAELKSTVCVTRGDRAFLSAHIGDLDDLRNYNFFQESVRDFLELLEVSPAVVAHDMHPDYVSTRYALGVDGVRREQIQHHHAHIASCLAEHQLAGKAIGIALDGTGYGTDGTIWGGEIMIADLCSFQRVGHFKQYPMPGGKEAVLEPARMALSILAVEFGADAEKMIEKHLPSIPGRERAVLLDMVGRKAHSPLTSSAGRLFDAVAALLGLGERVSYEGRAAVCLQALADKRVNRNYPYEIQEENGILVLSLAKTVRAIVGDLEQKKAGSHIAAMFHNTIAAALAEACVLIRQRYDLANKNFKDAAGPEAHALPIDSDKGRATASPPCRLNLNRVALSGGVFQNDFLLDKLTDCLKREGFEVYTNQIVPPNDGGISLGQAAVAAARNG